MWPKPSGAKYQVVQGGGDHYCKIFSGHLIDVKQLKGGFKSVLHESEQPVDCQCGILYSWRQGKGYCTSEKVFLIKNAKTCVKDHI